MIKRRGSRARVGVGVTTVELNLWPGLISWVRYMRTSVRLRVRLQQMSKALLFERERGRESIRPIPKVRSGQSTALRQVKGGRGYREGFSQYASQA